MTELKTRLVNAPNKDFLFQANKREQDLRVYSEALKVDVQFNKELDKAEVIN